MRYLLCLVALIPSLAGAGSATDDCVNSNPNNIADCIDTYNREQGWSANTRGVAAGFDAYKLNLPAITTSAPVAAQAASMAQRAQAEMVSAKLEDQVHAQMLTNGAALTVAVDRDQQTVDRLEKIQQAAQQTLDKAKQGFTIFGTHFDSSNAVAADQAALDQANKDLEAAKQSQFANQANLDALNKIATDAGAAPIK